MTQSVIDGPSSRWAWWPRCSVWWHHSEVSRSWRPSSGELQDGQCLCSMAGAPKTLVSMFPHITPDNQQLRWCPPELRFLLLAGDSCGLLLEAFSQELSLRQLILQEVAHTKDPDLSRVYLSCWLHQPFTSPQTRLGLEALLLETGHRPLWEPTYWLCPPPWDKALPLHFTDSAPFCGLAAGNEAPPPGLHPHFEALPTCHGGLVGNMCDWSILLWMADAEECKVDVRSRKCF